MRKDKCLALVQLPPNRLHVRAAWMSIFVPVARKDHNSVRLQIVKGVGDFRLRSLRVQQTRQASEEAKFLWVLGAEVRSIMVGQLLGSARQEILD